MKKSYKRFVLCSVFRISCHLLHPCYPVMCVSCAIARCEPETTSECHAPPDHDAAKQGKAHQSQYEHDKGKHVGRLIAMVLTGLIFEVNGGPLTINPHTSSYEPTELEQPKEASRQSGQRSCTIYLISTKIIIATSLPKTGK